MSQRPKTATGSLRDVKWERFFRAPDTLLRDELYVPALSRAVRYDRCCAYFSSRVLAAAARGFGGFIQTLCALGKHAPKPAARLLVNEQLDPADLSALLTTGDQSKLIDKLLKQFKTPKDALEKNRLEMLAWLVASGLLEVRVGLMRNTQGVMHAKFGIVTDAQGDSLVFMGSDNETGEALTENYEELELSTSWEDRERAGYYRKRLDTLWADRDENVVTLPLPEAVRLKLIKFAPKEPPQELGHDKHALATAMLWRFIAAAPCLPNGEYACDATALVDLWPHQQRVVEDTTRAFPSGRLLCDEVGMGKTIEAILVLRRLLCGRGVKRALLLVPAGLLKQWQDELREKGGLLVPIWDANLFRPDGTREKMNAQAALARNPLLLVSREWARLEGNRETVLASPVWDLVLLDEAHAARRAKAEEGEFNTGNLLLQLLRELQLRRRTRGILLLSATPMQTQPYEPWDLLGVLGVGGQWMVDFHDIRRYYRGVEELNRGGALTPPLAKPITRLVAGDDEFPPPPNGVPLNNGKLSERSLLFVPKGSRTPCAEWLRRGAPLGRRMHRNTRETLRQYFEKGMLELPPPRREVRDEVFDYEPQTGERDCYEAIEQYINERFDQVEREKPGKGFVMTVYRRRMASSPLALRRSLRRRLARLEEVIGKHWTSHTLSPDEEGVDARDLSDADLDERIDPALPGNPKTAQAEKELVTKLLAKLEALGQADSKRDKFLGVLKDVTSDGRAVLVFTEYTDTLEYLRDLLRPIYGSTLGCYSGAGGQWWNGDNWVAVSKADITARLFKKDLQVLLCTDAASEGLNLQAASGLINYDLPWNPSKVEQRIGRIDRIGQQQAHLPIRNLFLTESVDMRVYQALRLRCGLFEHFVGRMQPVLALARDALRRNLRRRDAPSFIRELEREAERVSADGALANTFLESGAEKSSATEPPVTRGDLETALGWLEQTNGSVKAKRVKDQPRWRLTGLGKRAVEVTVDRETLERDEKILPLSVVSQEVQRIVERLGTPSRLPLVIADHHAGNYQASEARWVEAGGVRVVTSARQLQQLTQSWDGALPSPKLIVEAQEAARKVARRRAEEMRQTACATERASLQGQLEAARARLLRELGRTLRCTGSNDLNSLLRKQIERESHADERYHRALELLGGYPGWTAEILEDAQSFIAEMSAHDRQARVALPTPLDAALNDPRWIAQG